MQRGQHRKKVVYIRTTAKVAKCREYQGYCGSLKQDKEPEGREMWKEHFIELVKDVTLKYLFLETVVFLTEQQFSWEDLSFW